MNNIKALNALLKTFNSLIKKKQKLTFLYTKKQEIYQAARKEFITKYSFLDKYLKNHSYYEKEFILSLTKKKFLN